MSGQVARMRKMRSSYNIFIGKCEGKRRHGRSKRRWENNITVDLTQLDCEDVDWFHLVPGYGPMEDSCEHGHAR
jgi:hypothetical protein